MTKKKLLKIIEDKVNEIYYEYQEEEGIEYGDIYPWHAFELDELQEKLADLIIKSMKDNDRVPKKERKKNENKI